MSFSQIKKRNGAIVDFDATRIEVAIGKASSAANSEVPSEDIALMVENIVANLESILTDEAVPEVELVQDHVEQELMRSGHYKTARTYIVYRDTHQALREAMEREASQKLEQNELKVVAKDGSVENFSYSRLIKDLLVAADGLDDVVNVDELAQAVKTNLYDGMTTNELEEAMIMATKAYIERDKAYSQLAARLLMRKLRREVLILEPGQDSVEQYRAQFNRFVTDAVKNDRLDKRMADFDLNKLSAALKLERDDLLDYMGLHVLYGNYLLRSKARENVLELPQYFWMRVAMGMAIVEKKDKTEWAIKFYEVLSSLRYVASSPTLFNSGTNFSQLSSCFLNTVEDDLKHIYKVYLDTALMSKFSGGIATDWTNVRATGSQIKTIDVTSQGVIPFLKIANDSTVAIARSGRRIGATAVYLESWHLDIEDFLELRKNTGDERRRTHDINTANWIPDLFMKRVMADGQWTLFSPDDTPDLHDLYGKAFEKRYVEYEKLADQGKITLHKRVSAAGLWRKMLSMLFETGHPWITFKDPSNLRSPQDHVGVVHNSNLCTEITLNNSKEETAVCNLGSVNLAKHMNANKLDVELLKDTISYAVRMLDNVIDLCYYVTKETERANMNNRPVGLGIMGHQDALYMQDVDFASEAAVRFADESMEVVSYYAIMASSELAQERGAYKTYKGSKWDRGIFPVDTLDILERERGQKLDIPRGGKLDWKPVRASVKKHGIRNSNVMAIAPTASIANVVGCVPCIEPIYKNLYVKSNMSGDFTVLNGYLIDDLKELGLWSETMLGKIKYFDGSIQQIEEIPAKIRAKYKEVFEIEPEWLIKAAAYRGKWIDQSQSLNIYMRGVSGKKLSDAYMYAWKMGLKTTYYLRTLAASQVEKSTVSTSEFGATHKRDFTATPSEPTPVTN